MRKICWQNLRANRLLLCSWDDQGDLGERSTHLALQEELINPDSAKRRSMASGARDKEMKIEETTRSEEETHDMVRNPGGIKLSEHGMTSTEGRSWALEIYKGHTKEDDQHTQVDGVLELDLDEEAEISLRNLAIGVFYSRKSYNPKYLFADMLNAWGIPKLAVVEKLGDYCFRIEFIREEEKKRVIEGGPWWHKGDALIVVHYDGLTRPSQVSIESIGIWACLLDLPPAMMKEAFAKQLGGQLGKFVKMDSRYPGYLRVRVEYPLRKALQPLMTVKIKGRGAMVISLRYENVPHFCFHCGCMGHVAVNCVCARGTGGSWC
jgi:hypothetical protein